MNDEDRPRGATRTETTATPPDAADSSAWPTVRRLGPQGRYHLEERVAAGGAATVWRAYDEHLDRSVAIKILHPHLVGDDDTILRFERESRNAARLHHPNAIQIYDSGRINDVVYLVMEFVDGPTLKSVLEDHGALEDWKVAAAIGEQIAAALAEAHVQDLIHRDIKPANILFTTEGIVKVVDFGIAKALSSATMDLTAEGTTVGTATYIAPEQYTGAEVDARADVYALGMVMYECLTGRPAFAGDTPTAVAAARLTREVLPPRQVRADVDRRLEDVIVRCTRRDPDERYSDVAAVAHALRQLNAEVEPHELTRDLVAASPPDEPVRPQFPDVDPEAVTDPGMPTGTARSRVRMAIAFLAGIVLTIVAVMALTGGDGSLGEEEHTLGNAQTVMRASDYDPWGGDGENPQAVSSAYDNDVTTTWQTEGYRAGFTKPGVGLWFELGDQPVSQLEIAFLSADVEFSIYGRDEPPDQLTPEEAPDGFPATWGAPIASFTAESPSSEYPLEETQNHAYWLLWLTDLPADQNGTRRAELAEIKFVGPEESEPTSTATEDPGTETAG